MAGIRQAIRDYLEAQGFMVDLVKRLDTDQEKVLVYFDLDRIISFEQVRNGIIRNQSEAARFWKRGNLGIMIDMEIAEQYGLSYVTFADIRWGKR